MKIQLDIFDVLESTNETAVAAANDGALEGTVIVAKRQEGGHGRMQRVWNSPEGGLWFTILLRPKIDSQFIAQVTLLAGVAVAKGLRKAYCTDKICIKWPNDLLWDGKKVCGILSEMQLKEDGSVDYAIVGIGVNVGFKQEEFPEDVRKTAVVLNDISGMNLTCEEVLDKILQEFVPLYESWQLSGSQEFLTQWQELNCTLGNVVNVKDNDKVIFRGIAKNIDSEGALLVKADNGEIRSYNFGEISIR